MKFFKRLQQLREADRAAIQTSWAHLAETMRTEPEVNREHELALNQLQKATEMAHKLGTTDRRNHYSESLTHAFRGKLV